MPRYLFHVCDGAGFCEDADGIELPDRDAAFQEAIRSARSLMVDEIIQGRLSLASFIEVEDENGVHLFTVTFEDAVEIEPVTPQSPRSRRG